MRRVGITGLGAISGFGDAGAGPLFDALMRGDSRVAEYAPSPALNAARYAAMPVADFDANARLGPGARQTLDRGTQFALAAALTAWQDANLPIDAEADRTDAAVCWGTALGGVNSTEHSYFEVLRNGKPRVSPLLIVSAMHNAPAAHIAMRLGLAGPAATTSVACASSAIAIGDAMRLIRGGAARIVVAGGSEAALTAGMLMSWEAMRVMASPGEAPQQACRPFDRQRAGLVLGEGAAALVLEEFEHAHARGARVYAELAGYGASCDHRHLTRPAVAGQVRAIEAALADAGLERAEIGYINAHGTATQEGDPTEIESIRRVFGVHAERIAVSATKSMHGHMLGATGAMEALIAAAALWRQQVPPTAHLRQVDPACAGVQHIAALGVARPLKAALSNCFAFGGSNAVLALRSA